MTKETQIQNTIKPMEEEASAAPKDPAQEDYENGKKYLKGGDLGSAAAAFHNALIGFEQSGDEKGIANALNQMGDVCVQRGEQEKAMDFFERAYEMCEKLRDPFSIVVLQKKMAQIHRSMEQYEDAIRIYLDILETYRMIKNPSGAVKLLTELAETYMEQGDRDKAADSYRTAASIHSNFKHSREAKLLLDKAAAIEGADGY